MAPSPPSPGTPATGSRVSGGPISQPRPHRRQRRFTSAAERLLRLGKGEFRPGALLFAYLFLINAACTAAASVGSALFLDRFRDATKLPLADIGVVAGVTVTAAAYMRLGRTVLLRNLLVGSLVAFAATSLVFYWLVLDFPSAWPLMPAIYVWAGVLGVLARTQVWTLANHVLTLRQAKRLFALVGSGSILGWIAGGALTTAFSRAKTAESLLLVMSLAFVTSAILVQAIWSGRPASGRGDARRTARPQDGRGGLRAAAAEVWSSRYLRLIGVLIGLASLAATITKWQLKAAATASLSGRNEYAAFFGAFDSFAGLAALVVQVLLAAPVLRSVGLGGVLAIVPLALAAGSAGLLAIGSLAAAAVLRGSDQALRYSIDKSAKELLYLPIPRAQTFQVKSFLETIVCPVGDAIACLGILLFTRRLGATPQQLAWLTLALAAAWVMAARLIHHEYLRNLAEALRQNRVDVQGATTVLDRATTQLIASHLAKGESKRVLSALNLVEASHAQSVLPNVEALISHPSPAVRARALSVLSSSRPTEPPSCVETLLLDPDLRVRSEALLCLARAGLDPLERLKGVGDFEDLSVRSSMVAYLARPGRRQNLEACRELLNGMLREAGPEGRKARIEAARLLASLPRLFDDQLALLLADEDPDVVRHAIRAAGRLRVGRYVPRIIDGLAVPVTTADAVGALVRFGDRVVPKLSACLADESLKIEARRELPKVLLRIGTPAAEQALADNLAIGDEGLRFEAVSALNQLKRRHPTPPVDPSLVERVLVGEILAQYKSYLRQPPAPDRTASSDTSRQLECTFRLLQLLLPGTDINSAYVGVQSADPVVRDKALEFLDNVLAPHLRKMLVPLIDGKVEREELAAIAARLCAGA